MFGEYFSVLFIETMKSSSQRKTTRNSLFKTVKILRWTVARFAVVEIVSLKLIGLISREKLWNVDARKK